MKGTLVNTIMSLEFLQKTWNFLPSWLAANPQERSCLLEMICYLGFVTSYKHRCLLLQFPNVRICTQEGLPLDLTLKLPTPVYIRTTIFPEPHLIFVHWSAARRTPSHNMTPFCRGIGLTTPASASSCSNIHLASPYRLLQVTRKAGGLVCATQLECPCLHALHTLLRNWNECKARVRCISPNRFCMDIQSQN